MRCRHQELNAQVVRTKPSMAEKDLENAAEIEGRIAIVDRGVVPFVDKAERCFRELPHVVY